MIPHPKTLAKLIEGLEENREHPGARLMEDYTEPRYLNRVKISGQRYKDWLILCDDCLEKMQDEGQDARNYGMVIGDYSCERCGKKD